MSKIYAHTCHFFIEQLRVGLTATIDYGRTSFFRLLRIPLRRTNGDNTIVYLTFNVNL